MGTGAITQSIDVAQLVLYAFWIFFACLVVYLRREDKREGYPLETGRPQRVPIQGFPAMPEPKTFRLRDGREIQAPNPQRAEAPLGGRPTAAHGGAPLEPIGDPMLAAVGPGSYAMRADLVDLTADDLPRIVPLRAAPGFSLSAHDPDPIGLVVIGADGREAGSVVDAWVDRSEVLLRYLEVEVASGEATRRVLLPVNFCRIGQRQVRVASILAAQFARVPGTRQPDVVTLLEEERVMAYYGGGTLYATPDRQEPLL